MFGVIGLDDQGNVFAVSSRLFDTKQKAATWVEDSTSSIVRTFPSVDRIAVVSSVLDWRVQVLLRKDSE